MKIGSLLDTFASSDVPARSATRAEATQPVTSLAPTDQATVSAAAVQMGAQSGSADFDSAKVDAIRQAIREGRFSVNPEAIADRLIVDAAALLSPRSV